MSIIDNVLRLLEEKNKKPSELCAYIGINTSNFTNWKNRNTDPPAKYIYPICEFLGVSTDYLLTGKEKSPSAEQSAKEQLSPDEQELLEYFSVLSHDTRQKLLGRAELLAEQAKAQPEEQEEAVILMRHSLYMVSAGTGFELDEGDSWDEIAVPDTRKARKADFCVTVSGDSMEPSFSNGNVVLVKITPAVDIGQIGIFRIGQKGYIKEYGGDRLISLNPKYDDILFADYDLEDISCCGLVLGIAKEEE